MNKRILRSASLSCSLFPAALAAHVPGTASGAGHCALGWSCTRHAFEHLIAAAGSLRPGDYLVAVAALSAAGCLIAFVRRGSSARRRCAAGVFSRAFAKAFHKRITPAG